MMWDPAIAAAERTEAARHLIAQARVDVVDLVTLSALELCVLGGLRQPLFEERVARAWTQLGERQRRKVMDEGTAGLVRRGLLVDDSPQPGKRGRGGTYAIKPELGLMLAARSRPSSIVVTDIGHPNLRTQRFYVLGDQTEPVRGVVVEEPAALPADIADRFPYAQKLGPLGWFYQYFLVSPAKAAEILAELTISPPRHAGVAVAPGWTVAAYCPASRSPEGERLSIRGDGVSARVDSLGTRNGSGNGTEYDAAGLRAVMYRLFVGPV